MQKVAWIHHQVINGARNLQLESYELLKQSNGENRLLRVFRDCFVVNLGDRDAIYSRGK